jgi:hypothetical protein
MLRVLCDSNQTFQSWEQIFPTLQAETFEASGSVHKARAFVIREEGQRLTGRVSAKIGLAPKPVACWRRAGESRH